MGWPSAPLRRGPDGLEFWLQGTMLKVAPVSTKHLSLVNLSVRNIKPAFAGKCIALGVTCVEKAAEPKGVWRQISFPTKNRAPVSPIGVVVMKFAHAIARVLKRMKAWAGRGATFGAGITAPFVASLPIAGSRALASLCRGGWDRGVVVAPSVP
jgi:hypothetical protein